MRRNAERRDVAAIIGLLLRAHGTTARQSVPCDREKMRQHLEVFIASPVFFSQVLEAEGKIVGVLIGAAVAPWYSQHMQASDLEFYVDPEYRGHGLSLERAFTRWASGLDAVVELQRSITVGGESADRAARFYQRRGYTPVGQVFTKRVER